MSEDDSTSDHRTVFLWDASALLLPDSCRALAFQDAVLFNRLKYSFLLRGVLAGQ